MARTEILVIVAALVVAGGVLMQAVSTPSAEPPTEPPVAAARPAPTEADVVATEAAPMPEVSGIPDSVAAVLAASGHAEFVGTDELLADLPPSVVSVLIDADVTLRVAETSP